MSIVVGVDLSQGPAICCVEIEDRKGQAHFMVRYFEQLAPQNSHQHVAEILSQLVEEASKRSQQLEIYLNAAEPAETAVELMRSDFGQIRPVHFSLGHEPPSELGSGELTLGKAWLVSRLQLLVLSQRLHLPRSSEAEALAEQLINPPDLHLLTEIPGDELITALGLAAHAELPSFAVATVLEARGRPPHVVVVDFERINSALLKHLKAQPEDIHRLSWSSFEKLTERLLRELGYEVERTPLTGDGGVDIWALQRGDLGEVLYAIDAKKYHPQRLIGPEQVRTIYGVTNIVNASAGMIITTSGFTKGARALEGQYPYRISLKDYKDLVDWLGKISS